MNPRDKAFNDVFNQTANAAQTGLTLGSGLLAVCACGVALFFFILVGAVIGNAVSDPSTVTGIGTPKHARTDDPVWEWPPKWVKALSDEGSYPEETP